MRECFYSISFNDPPPDNFEQYNLSETISRREFISLFLDSFAISRGRIHRQVIFLDWVKVHSGLDWHETMDNFLKDGGWDVLTDEERRVFTENFDKIKAHRKRGTGMDYNAFHQEPAITLKGQIIGLLEDFEKNEDSFSNHPDTDEFILAYGDLKDMNRVTFLRNLDEYSSQFDEDY